MTIKGSVYVPTEKMSERDTMEALCDGLAKSTSAAREIAADSLNPEWDEIAKTLDAFKHGVQQLANMRSMSRFETLMAASIKANPKGFLN